MVLDKNCSVMMSVMKKMYKKKKKQWDAAPGNRRLAVEVGFIYNIYNDVVFLTKMNLNVKNEKYFYLILRNCYEHVIIFRFLTERSKTDPNVFGDYMGDNIDFRSILCEQNEFKALKKLGGERTTTYKNKFYKMACEFEDTKSDTSLYNYYGMLADDCHNSYFHCIEKIINKEKKCDRKFILVAIFFMLTEFCEGVNGKM
ncbi:hypothetical protein DWZ37_05160 [Clostridiaceae bacterium AF31-3BH]|nr:hypothetical protein DWZ37_05160 [Clostridiaceae bacterium AF31-3BH]